MSRENIASIHWPNPARIACETGYYQSDIAQCAFPQPPARPRFEPNALEAYHHRHNSHSQLQPQYFAAPECRTAPKCRCCANRLSAAGPQSLRPWSQPPSKFRTQPPLLHALPPHSLQSNYPSLSQAPFAFHHYIILLYTILL